MDEQTRFEANERIRAIWRANPHNRAFEYLAELAVEPMGLSWVETHCIAGDAAKARRRELGWVIRSQRDQDAINRIENRARAAGLYHDWRRGFWAALPTRQRRNRLGLLLAFLRCCTHQPGGPISRLVDQLRGEFLAAQTLTRKEA